jgi:hypothetical protein
VGVAGIYAEKMALVMNLVIEIFITIL